MRRRFLMTPNKIRLSLDVTPKMKKIIEELAEEAGTNQGEILRRAIALLSAVKNAEMRGESAALVKAGKVTAKLVGF
jgi:hypothetical protein